MMDAGGRGVDNRVLVVEDDAILARCLERALVRLGYSVRLAGSCAEARRTTDGVVQCGIFDIELGDGDGVACALAMLEERKVTTVVFYTASLDADTRRRAARVGRVIDKLAPFAELTNHLAELMTVRRTARARAGP